jgi:predicted nucleic acid-binding protein
VSLIRERLTFYRRFEVATTTPELIAGALDLHVLHGLSFYDALIVQAALASGCQRVLTEDMQNGARFGGVQIVNPFLN